MFGKLKVNGCSQRCYICWRSAGDGYVSRRKDGKKRLISNHAIRPIDGSPPNEDRGAEQTDDVPSLSDRVERKRLWMAAIKPPMYSVGFVPVLVAAAAVYAEHGVAPGLRCAGLVLASILIIAWLNLSNDAFDAATGVDKAKRESVVNLTGGKKGLVLLVANAFLLGGISMLGSLLASIGGDIRPAAMLALAIACGYVYQGPPFRFSYKGLGEPLCFLAFGPLATPAFYLALKPRLNTSLGMTEAIPALVWALAACVGISTTIILFCSHFHQIDGDLAAGKMSPLVRLGTDRAVVILRTVAALPHVVVAAAAALSLVTGLGPLAKVEAAMPFLAASLLTIPAGRSMLEFASINHKVPAAIAPLKIFATKLHMAWGLSLVLGLVLGKFLTR